MELVWIKMHLVILERTDLTGTAKNVFTYLADRQGDNEECWPSLRTIAAAVGIHRETAAHAIGELEYAHLLEVRRPAKNHGRRANRYRILWPRGADATGYGRVSRLVGKPGQLCPRGADSYGRAARPDTEDTTRPNSISLSADKAAEIVAVWNEHCPFAKVHRMTKPRRAALRVRWKEAAFRDGWQDAIVKIGKSAFCHGENERGWVASFDWLVKNDTGYVRAIEGRYDDRKQRADKARNTPADKQPRLPRL